MDKIYIFGGIMMGIFVTQHYTLGKETLVITKALDCVIVRTWFVGDISMHNYETQVFRSSMLSGEIEDGDEYDVCTYSTRWQSELGHDKMVEKWANETRDITTLRHYDDYPEKET